MKRIFFLFLFIFASVYVFAQSFINKYIIYLGKTVPNGFICIDESFYKNNDILLNVKNNIVISSGWTEEYSSDDEADFYYDNYCNLFTNNGWTFFLRDLHCDVYKYGDIYVVLSKPELSTDNDVLVISIFFYLEEYYDTLLDNWRGG